MTDEELKNKCIERVKIFQQAMESCHSSSPIDCIEWFADRISDLEKEKAELKTQVKTAYRKGMRHIAKALKDYDRTDGAWTDYFEHTVDKVLQREQTNFEEYGTLSDQLTKAKDHIKKLLDCLKQDTNDPQTNYYVCQYMDKAEQFLKDCEKEC